jgi:hypothetical protein
MTADEEPLTNAVKILGHVLTAEPALEGPRSASSPETQQRKELVAAVQASAQKVRAGHQASPVSLRNIQREMHMKHSVPSVPVPRGEASECIADALVIEITPHFEVSQSAALVHYDRFDSWLDGRLLCISRQPLAEGWDPATPLVMRQAGSVADSLRGSIGTTANVDINGSGTGFTRRARRSQDEGTGPLAASNDLPLASTPDGVGGAP